MGGEADIGGGKVRKGGWAGGMGGLGLWGEWGGIGEGVWGWMVRYGGWVCEWRVCGWRVCGGVGWGGLFTRGMPGGGGMEVGGGGNEYDE